MRDLFEFSNRYTVLLLDVTLFLLKAIGGFDFLTSELNVLFWTLVYHLRGIHQIGLSQCESEALEGCFGGCSPRHWRRCLLLTGYHRVLMGTTESYWVHRWVLLRITELYWVSLSNTGLLFRSWYWQGACSEACWLGMPGGLRWQVHHISLLKVH